MSELDLEYIKEGHLVRWYEAPGILRYSEVITVVKRDNGYYELLGWVRPFKANIGYHYEFLQKLEDKMRCEIPDFAALTGTFGNDILQAQEKLWQKYYILVPLKQVEKEYNGKILKATYIRFDRIKE